MHSFSTSEHKGNKTLANVFKNGQNSSTTTIAMVSPLQYVKWKNNNEGKKWNWTHKNEKACTT